MKRKFDTFILCVVLAGTVHAQGNNGNTPADTNAQNDTRWKLDGNMLNSEKFIGTLNNKDLIFKSNNMEGLRITPNRDIKIPGQMYMDLHRPQNPGDLNFLSIEHNGKIRGMEKGALLAEIYKDPCYTTFNLDGTSSLVHSQWASADAPGYGIIYTGTDCNHARVGIGTDNPTAALEVIGSGHFHSPVIIGTPSPSQTYGALHVEGLAYTKKISIGGIAYNYKAYIKTDDGEALHIDAPNANNWDYVTRISVPNGNAKAIAVHNNSHGDAFQVLANGRIATYITDPSYAMIIHNANNNDSKIFEVKSNGVVYANEIIVTLDPFPDYVFEKDYHLMPIGELNSFIQKNGHLPNMPTAEEVDKNGIGTGELQIKLVEKVEELTLYLLEMKEELEDLKEENAVLKAKVESK